MARIGVRFIYRFTDEVQALGGDFTLFVFYGVRYVNRSGYYGVPFLLELRWKFYRPSITQ
jgi:hypothetical protein